MKKSEEEKMCVVKRRKKGQVKSKARKDSNRLACSGVTCDLCGKYQARKRFFLKISNFFLSFFLTKKQFDLLVQVMDFSVNTRKVILDTIN